MRIFHSSFAILLLLAGSGQVFARPYPVGTGMAASADSASTAGSNPAGIARFTAFAAETEILWFASESNWESEFTQSGRQSNSKDSTDTVVPRVALIQPITDTLNFSFTFLGTGFSDDLGDWPGRYFIKSYDSVFVSAFPSLAYRINEQWSVAASVALTYSSFEQEKAVLNLFDPGFGDGLWKIESDSLEVGYGLSTLYQITDRTRLGLTYQSEIEPDREGDSDFSGLGPRTEAAMQRLGILDVDINVASTSPQSMLAGVYHEFTNNHALTADLVWIDFSNFQLSQTYFNGQALIEPDTRYNDIYSLSSSYTWPASERWMLGVGGLVTNQMIDDDERTMTLRLDTTWSAGVSAQWKWTPTRRVKMSVSYVGIDDAPVATPSLPIVGSLEGKFKSRDMLVFQLGVNWGSL